MGDAGVGMTVHRLIASGILYGTKVQGKTFCSKYEDHGFIYTVFTRPTVQEWQAKVGEVNHEVNEVNHEVNEVNLHIMQILKDNPQCTIPDLATACNVSRATVDRAVKTLKDANRIRRVGGTRGHWEVCD